MHEFFHGEPLNIEQNLINLFEETTTLSITPNHVSKAQVDVCIRGPYFEISGYGGSRALTWVKSQSEASIKRGLIESALRDGLGNLYNDCRTSKETHAPLGAATNLENFLLQFASSPTGLLDDKVAFELSLPFVDNIPVKEMLQIRESEGAAFNAFRARIQQAIAERVRATRDPEPTKIARQIQSDLIEPELMSLRHKLNRNAAIMNKTFAGAGIGALTGIVGLLIPALGPMGAAAGGILSAASINSAFTLSRDRAAIESGDMYFLWAAGSRHE